MSAQDRTLDQYHEYMQINSVSHILRSARDVGLIDALLNGQRTKEQLTAPLGLQEKPTQLVLDALVAIGIVEKYGDDYALSRAAQLLCQYDKDLGDSRWSQLTPTIKGAAPARDEQQHFDLNAATQWIHTPSAMQAAEILNIGGEDERQGPSILDLGCGSAVWSCAMAHRDPAASVTAVDHQPAVEAAQKMADSIELGDRFQSVVGDPMMAEVPNQAFDIVLMAQRLHAYSHEAAETLLRRAVAFCKPDGRIVVIDLFRGPTKPNLTESVEALRLELETQSGSMRSLEEAQRGFANVGLRNIQFTFLAASRVNMGLLVGTVH